MTNAEEATDMELVMGMEFDNQGSQSGEGDATLFFTHEYTFSSFCCF